MHLSIIRQQRRRFREISVLDETASVGITLDTMVFDELDAVCGGFAEFVPRVRRDCDDDAL
jgi:hypothetical protein